MAGIVAATMNSYRGSGLLVRMMCAVHRHYGAVSNKKPATHRVRGFSIQRGYPAGAACGYFPKQTVSCQDMEVAGL